VVVSPFFTRCATDFLIGNTTIMNTIVVTAIKATTFVTITGQTAMLRIPHCGPHFLRGFHVVIAVALVKLGFGFGKRLGTIL